MQNISGLTDAQSDIVKNIMRSHGFDSLKKTQRLAFEDGILDNDNHLLVADTGNGKTLCAEAVISQDLENNGRVAYLVPSRQLVRDKKSSIEEWCDKKVMSGSQKYSKADVIVATFESFYRAILRNTGNVRSIDRIVLDDFHEIYSSYRGPDIEKAISAALYQNINVFAMSATVGNPHELAEWINGDYTISPEGREISIYEEAVEVTQSSKKKAVADFVGNHKSKAPFLVFNYAKSWTSSRAQEIADKGVFDDTHDENLVPKMREKVDGELTDSLEELAEMMNHGVAYHHSNLPPQVKQWIEELYDSGKIQCICATTTIAYGFDAPVQTVVVADIKRRGQWVGVWEYVQWIGRAARPGYGYDKGYAYTLTNDVQGTTERYFSKSREIEAVETHIENEALLRKLFLELVATGWDTPEKIENFIENTFFWQQLQSEGEGAWGRGFGDKRERVQSRLRSVASWLEHHDFLKESQTNAQFNTTQLGDASVEFLFSTFGSYTLTQIRDFYENISKQDFEKVELLQILSQTFEQSLGERKCKDELSTKLNSRGISVDEYGITAGLVQWYWCQNYPINEIEQRVGIDATYLPNLSRQMAQLMKSVTVLFEANLSSYVPDWYDTYTVRVEKGIRQDEVPLVKDIRGFGRYRARNLREYLDDISTQQSLPDGTIWEKLEVLYENSGDRTKFEAVLRSNVTGIGNKTAEKIAELVIDRTISEEYLTQDSDEEMPDSKSQDLDDWM